MVETEQRPGDRARLFGAPRWLVILAGLVVALIFVGFVALKVIFPPKKLRAMVVPRIEAAVGRDVELSAVRLKVFPRIAVRLDDLTIANPPGFSEEPAVRLEALELQVGFWPLLRRQIDLRQVRLLSPAIRYEVRADGTSNFAGMGAGEAESAAPAPAEGQRAAPGGAASSLFISDLVLTNGRLLYSDARAGRGARLGLEARANADRAPGAGRALTSSGQVDLVAIRALSPSLGPDSVSLSDVKLEYELFADLRGDSVRLSRLRVHVGELPLEGTGVLRGPPGGRSLDFALESGEVDVAKLLASLPPALRREELDASGKARLSLKALGPMGGGSKPDVSGVVELRDIDAAYAEYGRVLGGGAGRLTFDANSASIPTFTGKLLDRPLELQATLTDFAAPVMTGRLKAGADLARLSKLRGSETPASGEVSVDLSFNGPVRDRSALRVTGPVALSNIDYQPAFLKVPAKIKSATVRLTGTGVSAERIPIQMGKSDLTLSLTSQRLLQYTLSRDSTIVPFVEFTARSDRLDVPEVWNDTAQYGYGALMSARLAGRKLDGRDPTEIARERFKLTAPPPLGASGRVEIDEFLNAPTEGKNVALDVTLNNGVLELKNLAGQVYGGQLAGGMTFDFSGGQAPFPVRYDIRLKDAQGAAFVSRWTRLGNKMGGLLDFNVAGTAALDEALLPSTNAVVANGRSTLREGRFDGFGPAQALINSFKFEERVVNQFKELGGNFSIKDGAFILDNWAYEAGSVKAGIGGSAALGGTLDLKLALELPPAVLERAGLIGGTGPLAGVLGQLRQDNQPIQVAVGLGGTISEPALKVDSEALQKTLEARLKGTGKDLLKQLIKPPRN